MKGVIRHEIKSLSERDKTILMKFAFDHKTVDEIAYWFDTTPDEILKTLSEALEKIKAEVDEHEEELL